MKLLPPSYWETDNDWGVPLLEASRCAPLLPLPLVPWASQAQKKEMKGTWHFYIEDRKFEGLWCGCDRLLQSSPLALIEPNFSVPWDAPGAVAVYQTYRKRWIARTLQAAGIFVIVDLNVDYRHERINLLGVPQGWTAYATRGSAWDSEILMRQWVIARQHSGVERPLFIVYSGGNRVERLCRENGWQYYPTYRGPMTYRNRPPVEQSNIFLEETFHG